MPVDPPYPKPTSLAFCKVPDRQAYNFYYSDVHVIIAKHRKTLSLHKDLHSSPVIVFHHFRIPLAHVVTDTSALSPYFFLPGWEPAVKRNFKTVFECGNKGVFNCTSNIVS
jgi:hypothetical protein